MKRLKARESIKFAKELGDDFTFSTLISSGILTPELAWKARGLKGLATTEIWVAKLPIERDLTSSSTVRLSPASRVKLEGKILSQPE